MHSTAERGGASRRRRVSRGKRESQHEEENELQVEEKERAEGRRVAVNGEGRRCSARRLKRELKEGYSRRRRATDKGKKVGERTFGTSSRTKSNFGPTTKLSYFLRNMHAQRRAQVFRRCFSSFVRSHPPPYSVMLALLSSGKLEFLRGTEKIDKVFPVIIHRFAKRSTCTSLLL